jgi:hypothetical protein
MDVPKSLDDYKSIFSNRTNLYFFLQSIPGTVGWGVFFQYSRYRAERKPA